MSKDVIAALEAELARAVADQEFEMAAALRDRIQAMQEGRPTGSMLRRPDLDELGASDHQRAASPKGRPLPKRPDPMTKIHKPGSRGQR